MWNLRIDSLFSFYHDRTSYIPNQIASLSPRLCFHSDPCSTPFLLGKENKEHSHQVLHALRLVKAHFTPQTVNLIGKPSYRIVAIATHRLPLTLCCFQVLRVTMSLGYVCDCISKQSDKGCESLETETFKKENPCCRVLFFSIPHSISTKRFTCHHRLPSSFNKRSKRKCLALSGRVWLFKTTGNLV